MLRSKIGMIWKGADSSEVQEKYCSSLKTRGSTSRGSSATEKASIFLPPIQRLEILRDGSERSALTN
jgi:hypothetical protein